MIEICLTKELSMLDTVYKIAMILIAFVNILFAFYIFFKKNKQEEINRTKSQNIDWFKSLILNFHLDSFYSFYSKIHETSRKIMDTSDDSGRIAVNDELSDIFAAIRKESLELISVASLPLYKTLLDNLDNLQDHLSEKMSDAGNNFSHKPKFDDLIENEINKSKVLFIRSLFSYSG